MKVDAHYYAVLAFCRACGFSKGSAHKVAYASQFVDDAKINHIVIQGFPPQNIQHDVIDNQPSFFNMATCHSYTRTKTYNYSAMINNTCAFHFVPGCKGKNFAKKLRCTEESPVIKDILTESLEQDDLVKFGIVLHTYADTFSHQGFSGLLSKVNDIKECKILSGTSTWSDEISMVYKLVKYRFDRLLDLFIPVYGHGQATVFPDLPYLIWSYKYDYSDQFSTLYKSSGKIENKKRFVRAFQKIRKNLDDYLKKHPQYRDENLSFKKFDILFDTLVAKGTDKARVKKWQETLVSQGLLIEADSELVYDENRWLKEAFKNFEEKKFGQRKVENVELTPGFSDSNWYKYYLAVKWYKKRFFHFCSQYQLDIPL